MHRSSRCVFLLSIVFLCACSGGGGGTSVTGGAVWSKFRHDVGNSGLGDGSVEGNGGCIKSVQGDDGSTPAAISGSPVLGLDGSIYVGTEGGTLVSTDSRLNVRWRVTQCNTMGTPAAMQCSGLPLGPFVSSPVVYKNTRSNITSVVAADENGSLWIFNDSGSMPTCTACFNPIGLRCSAAAPACPSGESCSDSAGAPCVAASTTCTCKTDPTITGTSFLSSPTFLTNAVTLEISGVFIGATVVRGTNRSGVIYAVNPDGSLKWQYPQLGGPPIGTVTSSLAIGVGGLLLFSTDDGTLYALTSTGGLKWTFPIGAVRTTNLRLFDPSPLTSTNVYASAAGQIIAVTPDGNLAWRSPPTPGDDFAASLAIGNQADITPTPLPPGVPTPTPSSGTSSTTTPTPLHPASTLFGVTESGTLVVVDALTGTVLEPTGALPTPISGATVLSSPALSSDLYLVFGASNGTLYSVNSRTGLAPRPTPPCGGLPVQLTKGAAIRSSPSIGTDGTVYVGADDGLLYSVGHQ